MMIKEVVSNLKHKPERCADQAKMAHISNKNESCICPAGISCTTCSELSSNEFYRKDDKGV